jgi:hypothetical protein
VAKAAKAAKARTAKTAQRGVGAQSVERRVQTEGAGRRNREQGLGAGGWGVASSEGDDEARRFSKRLSEARIVKFACNVSAVGAGERAQVTPKGATDPRQTTGKGAQLNGLRATGLRAWALLLEQKGKGAR